MKGLWRTRVAPNLSRAERPGLASVAVVALVMGIIGFGRQSGLVLSTLDRIYYSIQLFTFEFNARPPLSWELQVARFLAPAVTLYAAGLALGAIFQDEIHVLRARRARGHLVICGLGRCGTLAATGFRSTGRKVVVLERDEKNEKIGMVRKSGVIVIKGNAADAEALRNVRLDRAAGLLVVCGDDGVNAEVVAAARSELGSRDRRPLRAIVQVIDFTLGSLLGEFSLATNKNESLRLEFFNVAERGAPAMLEAFPPFPDQPAADAIPHLLIVGLGEMGRAVLALAALRWSAVETTEPLRVTVTDHNAARNIELLNRRHPALAELCDLTLRELDVRDPDFADGTFLDGLPEVSAAYVCLSHDTTSLAAGLALQRCGRLAAAPIVVRITEYAHLASLLVYDEAARNLHAFEVLDAVCRPDVLLAGPYERIAREVHLQHVASQVAAGVPPKTSSSIAGWDALDPVFQESSRRHAEHVAVKLAAVGYDIEPFTDWRTPLVTFTDDELETMARLEHDRWWRERDDEDWTLGPEKDERARTSPSLVSWDELSDRDREYDRALVREMPAMLAKVGFRVVRRNSVSS
jgi:hypothetical protein